MTRRPHLRRALVVVGASALFAVAASGSALAWSGAVRPQASVVAAASWAAPAAPAASGLSVSGHDVDPDGVAVPHAAPAVRAAVPVRTAAATTRTARAATATAAHRTASTSTSTSRTVTIRSYVDAPGSQAQIDRCHLVLWTRSPMWLAGHNWCGYQWMAYVPTGTTVVVTSGAARGRYVVTGHLRLGRQSGSLPSVSADLVLQTCVGSSTGLTLLHRA